MVRVAKNVVRDFGEEAASSSGLTRLSKCNEATAERDTHRVLVKRYKLSLPVPIRKLGRGKLAHSVLCLKDWVSFLLAKNCWHISCGLMAPNPEREAQILSEFWRRYEMVCPAHPVFLAAREGSIVLARTMPLLWHGDEGRGRRRQPFLVTSWHSVLGRGVRSGNQRAVQKPFLKLKANFAGHSYTHRFLHTAMAKKAFEDPEIFDAILEHCVEQTSFMHTHGVVNPHSKQKHWAMFLGVTGDWQFLFKSGKMFRSYNNVEKHTTQARNPLGICHLCNAGQHQHSFEQIQTRQPTWLGTFCSDNPFLEPSPLTTLPHPPGRVATIFKFDVWHSWHLGVGKCFIACALALMSSKYDGRSKEARMDLLSRDYLAWCSRTRHPPILTKLTQSSINWESNSSFPFGGWFKGALTTTLGKFIQDQLGPSGPDRFKGDEMLHLCNEAVIAINTCLTGLYVGDAFLEASTARQLGEHGLKFLRRYALLARKAVEQGQTMFSLLPKLHCLHHLFLQDLLLASESAQYLVNPLCYSVQLSEDFIGQLSRLSRRVHPTKCSERCIQRHLQLAHGQYVKAGYLIEAKDD